MSQWNGWTVEKAARSPAPGGLPSPHPGEIMGRLNFSYAKTPPPVILRKGPYGNMDTSLNVNNRLRDYHMSRQDPAVLDRMYTSAPTSPARQNGYLYGTSPNFANHVTHSNGHSMASPAGSYSRASRTALPTSLLRQTLTNSRRSSLPGGSSLVNMAVQRGGHAGSKNFSPVIVRLSGPATSSDGGGRGEPANRQEAPGMAIDPCDKETVMSALKKKRKRWATSTPDENLGHSDIFPSAKRSRPNHRVEVVLPYPRPQPQSLERKRLNEFPAIPQAAKRPRAPPTHLSRPSSSHRQSTASRSKVIIPDIEYVSDKELEQDDSTPTPDSAEPVGKNGGDKQSESLGSSRSSTPPLQEGEEELRRRREELVQREKSLTTVFPSSLTRKTSQRRKVPIFCATGSQPHIPSRLPLSCSATREDLQRDRDVAVAKLKDFLAAEDEEDVKESEKAAKKQATTTGLLPPPYSSSSSSACGKPTVSLSPPSSGALPGINLRSNGLVPHLGGIVTDAMAGTAKDTKSPLAPPTPVCSLSSPASTTGSAPLQTVLGHTSSSGQATTTSVQSCSATAVTTTSTSAPTSKTSLTGGGLLLKGSGIKLGVNSGATKSVSFSLTPSTVSIATSSTPSLASTVTTQSATQPLSQPLAGGIPLSQGLRLGTLGGPLSLPAVSTTASNTTTPSLTFKLPSVTTTSGPATSTTLGTTTLPTSGLFGAPPTSSTASLFLKQPGETSLGTTTFSQSTIMASQSQQPQVNLSVVSTSQPQPSLGLQVTQPSTGGTGSGLLFQSTSAAASVASNGGGQQSLTGIPTQSQGGLGTQPKVLSTAGIFGTQSQATASNQSLTSSSFSMEGSPFPSSQPTQTQGQAIGTSQTLGQMGTGQTSQAGIFGSSKLTIGGGGLFQSTTSQSQTFNFTGATGSQSVSFTAGANQSGVLGSQQSQSHGGLSTLGQSQTHGSLSTLGQSQTQGGLSMMGHSQTQGGLSTLGQSQTHGGLSMIGHSQTQGGLSTLGQSQTHGGLSMVGHSQTQGGLSTLGQSQTHGGLSMMGHSQTQGGLSALGQNQTQSGLSTVGKGEGTAPTFNFAAGANGLSQSQGLFGANTSSTNLGFNFSAQKPGAGTTLLGAGQPQTHVQQQLPSGGGLTFPAARNATGQTQSSGFNFSAGLASGPAKLVNFSAGIASGGQAQESKSASGIFNFSAQGKPGLGMGGQSQGSGGLFNQPQSNGLFNQPQGQSSGVFNQTKTQCSGGLFNQTQAQGASGLFNQTQAQNSGGLFNQTQSNSGLFNQTQSNAGLFNQAQSNGGLFSQAQAQNSGGLMNQLSQTQGQASGGVFSFGAGSSTPPRSNIFGSQNPAQNSNFAATFQTPQQPQPQGKLSFTPTPLPNPANTANPAFALSPSFNFTATKADSPVANRPVARARRRNRK